MAKRNLPQPFEIDKIRFKDCFTGPSFRHFGVLITRWVLTVGTHTVSPVFFLRWGDINRSSSQKYANSC